jgi:hypothetical protein
MTTQTTSGARVNKKSSLPNKARNMPIDGFFYKHRNKEDSFKEQMIVSDTFASKEKHDKTVSRKILKVKLTHVNLEIM